MNTPSLLLLSLALVTSATAAESSPARVLKPGTPGIQPGRATFDESTGTFLIRAEGKNAVPVLKDTQPQLSLQRYAVVGEVRYEKVGGNGYLELWNVFPPAKPGLPEGQYFTRTMDVSGPMAMLQGDNGWRPFVLPFDPAGAAKPPVRLELNVVLPEGGTVWLRNVRLVPAFAGVPWSRAAVVGTVGGCLLGLLAVIVTLCVKMGKGLTVANTAVTLVKVTGLICVLGAVVAALYQDWPVTQCFGLLGFIALFNIKNLRRQVATGIEEMERRRMSAADA